MSFIPVISGSARPGSNTMHVARHVVRLLAERPDVETQLIDVRDLPFGNLEAPHAYTKEPTPEATKFAETMSQADAVILVFPEYNHSFPGALKNVLDHLRSEWARKPFALVSTGGLSGGIRATDQLRQVIPGLNAMSVPATVSVPYVMNGWDETGPQHEVEAWATRFAALFDDLEWWTKALAVARDPPPQVEARAAPVAVKATPMAVNSNR